MCHFFHFWLTRLCETMYLIPMFLLISFLMVIFIPWQNDCNVTSGLRGVQFSWRILYPPESISILEWIIWTVLWLAFFRKEYKRMSSKQTTFISAATGALVVMTPYCTCTSHFFRFLAFMPIYIDFLSCWCWCWCWCFHIFPKNHCKCCLNFMIWIMVLIWSMYL